MAKWIKENNLKYKRKKEFMERKYDYHNYQYVLKQSEYLKIQKKYQLIKKKKMYTEDGDEKYECIEHWIIMRCYDYKIDNKTIDSSNWEIISEYKIKVTVDKHFKKRDNLNERDIQEIYSRELIIYNENTHESKTKKLPDEKSDLLFKNYLVIYHLHLLIMKKFL